MRVIKKFIKKYWKFIIWVVSLLMLGGFIIYYMYILDEAKYLLKGNIFSSLIRSMSFPMFVIMFIPIIDLLLHLMKKGKYRNKTYDIRIKALKVIGYYGLLIIIGTLFTCFLEITYDFTDKSNEYLYYNDEYYKMKDDSNYEVIKYQNNTYLKNKKFTYCKNDTMFKNDVFTDEFKLTIENPSRDNIKKIINIDSENIWNSLIEDVYYVVQTVSTLGYGNITPNYLIGMKVSIVLTLFGQFITIIGTVLLIREDTLKNTYRKRYRRHYKKYRSNKKQYRRR